MRRILSLIVLAAALSPAVPQAGPERRVIDANLIYLMEIRREILQEQRRVAPIPGLPQR